MTHICHLRCHLNEECHLCHLSKITVKIYILRQNENVNICYLISICEIQIIVYRNKIFKYQNEKKKTKIEDKI